MKIECILKRVGGTHITLGSTAYHFKPDDQGRHVANVDNEDHIKILMNIPEGYQPLDPLPQRTVSVEDALAALKEQFPGADLSAFLASTTVPAPKPAPAAEQAPDAPVSQADADDDDGDDNDNGLADLSDDEIRAEFEKLLGRKPHHNARRDTMEAQIIEALKSGAE